MTHGLTQRHYPHGGQYSDMHMDHGDSTPPVVNPREVRYNYCDKEKCYWHWKGRGDSRVKDVGVCIKNWAVDRSIFPEDAECRDYPTVHHQGTHMDSI